MISLKQLTLESYLAFFLASAIALQRISMGAGNILYGISILLFLISLFRQWKNRQFINKSAFKCSRSYFFTIGLAIVLSIPATINSEQISNSAKTLLELWVYRTLPLFMIPLCIKKERTLHYMLGAVFLSLSIDSLTAMYQYIELDIERGSGFSNNPLNLAAILAMILPVQAIIALEPVFPNLLRKIATIGILTNIIGLIGGKSRATWLLLALNPIFLCRYWLKKRIFAIVCLLLIVTLGGVVYNSPDLYTRLQSTTNTTTDRSNADRILVWESAFAMTKDHLLIGVGPGEFRDVYNKSYKSPEVTQDMIHTHNNFIQILTESGIIGLIGFMVVFGNLLIKNLINTFNNNPYAYIRLAITTFFLLFGLIDYTFDASAVMKLFWYIIGITLSLESLGFTKPAPPSSH
ncbi:O-antigen ligase [Veillonella sp. R32]|uniref:O-antigen ligase family protein n=1 Tax=Veillonella sp. R32 TaxID=2021312 RepID=UPI00138A5EF8|nr:O-antigen ligase family protein [Veillonella sp. R32]KAF1683448.1 hypothetical protein VER_01855 [Veillonella sp. R32]